MDVTQGLVGRQVAPPAPGRCSAWRRSWRSGGWPTCRRRSPRALPARRRSGRTSSTACRATRADQGVIRPLPGSGRRETSEDQRVPADERRSGSGSCRGPTAPTAPRCLQGAIQGRRKPVRRAPRATRADLPAPQVPPGLNGAARAPPVLRARSAQPALTGADRRRRSANGASGVDKGDTGDHRRSGRRRAAGARRVLDGRDRRDWSGGPDRVRSGVQVRAGAIPATNGVARGSTGADSRAQGAQGCPGRHRRRRATPERPGADRTGVDGAQRRTTGVSRA